MKIRLTNGSGMNEALANMLGPKTTAMDVYDVANDAKDGLEFLRGIRKLSPYYIFKLDREREGYIRLKGHDCWGNIHYLERIG